MVRRDVGSDPKGIVVKKRGVFQGTGGRPIDGGHVRRCFARGVRRIDGGRMGSARHGPARAAAVV